MTTHFLGDTAVLLGRSLRHITRSPDTIITTAIMPIAFMLLFVYVFGGAIDTGSGEYVDYLLPGILLITIAIGHLLHGLPALHWTCRAASSSGSSRCRSHARRVLWAHVLTSLVANLVSLVVVVLVALLMGFRSAAGVLAWLAVAGILVLFTLALTWIAVIAGLSAKSVDGASAFSYPIIFLPFISSAFVPTDSMPGPVRAFAENQPVTSIVDTIRDLFAQQPVGGDIWVALAWCLGILVVAYAARDGDLPPQGRLSLTRGPAAPPPPSRGHRPATAGASPSRHRRTPGPPRRRAVRPGRAAPTAAGWPRRGARRG